MPKPKKIIVGTLLERKYRGGHLHSIKITTVDSERTASATPIVIQFPDQGALKNTRLDSTVYGIHFVPFLQTLRAYCNAISGHAPCEIVFEDDFIVKKAYLSSKVISWENTQAILKLAAEGKTAGVELELTRLEQRFYSDRDSQPKELQECWPNDRKEFAGNLFAYCVGANADGDADGNTFLTSVHQALIKNNVQLAIKQLQSKEANIVLIDGRTSPHSHICLEDCTFYGDKYFYGFGGTYLHWAAQYLDSGTFKLLMQSCPDILTQNLNSKSREQTSSGEQTPRSVIVWALRNKDHRSGMINALFLLDEKDLQIDREEAVNIISTALEFGNNEIVNAIIRHEKIMSHWEQVIKDFQWREDDGQYEARLIRGFDKFISSCKDQGVETLRSLGLRFDSSVPASFSIITSIYDTILLEKILFPNNFEYKDIEWIIMHNNVAALKVLLQKGYKLPPNVNLLYFLTDPIRAGIDDAETAIKCHYEMVAYLINALKQDPCPTTVQNVCYSVFPICNIESNNVHTIMAFYQAMGHERFKQMMNTKMLIPQFCDCSSTPSEYLRETKFPSQGGSVAFFRSESASVQIIDYLLKKIGKPSTDLNLTLNATLKKIFAIESNLVALAAELQSDQPITNFALIYEHLVDYQDVFGFSDEVIKGLNKIAALAQGSALTLSDQQKVKQLYDEINETLSGATDFLFTKDTPSAIDEKKREVAASMVSVFVSSHPKLSLCIKDGATIEAFLAATSEQQREFINKQRESFGLKPLQPGTYVPIDQVATYCRSTKKQVESSPAPAPSATQIPDSAVPTVSVATVPVQEASFEDNDDVEKAERLISCLQKCLKINQKNYYLVMIKSAMLILSITTHGRQIALKNQEATKLFQGALFGRSQQQTKTRFFFSFLSCPRAPRTISLSYDMETGKCHINDDIDEKGQQRKQIHIDIDTLTNGQLQGIVQEILHKCGKIAKREFSSCESPIALLPLPQTSLLLQI